MMRRKSITQTENNQQLGHLEQEQCRLLRSLHDGGRTLTAARARGLTQIN